jgi:mono/diheme cytochrome c family protein
MIWLSVLLLQAAAAPNPQIERGQTLFFAEKSCGACHALKNRGTAVGPDIKLLGRVGVRALVTGIRASRTQYVETVKLKSGDLFPGMKVSQDTTTAQYYDLSKTPPELRKFAPTDLESKTDNSTWQHPPAVGGYTAAQLADIVSYIRWAAAGDKKPVNPGDVE